MVLAHQGKSKELLAEHNDRVTRFEERRRTKLLNAVGKTGLMRNEVLKKQSSKMLWNSCE